MKTSNVLMICSAALLLSACGGGSGDPVAQAPASEQVPDAANASTSGMAAWITSLAAALSESKEPLDTTGVTLPSPDDTEPETVR